MGCMWLTQQYECMCSMHIEKVGLETAGSRLVRSHELTVKILQPNVSAIALNNPGILITKHGISPHQKKAGQCPPRKESKGEETSIYSLKWIQKIHKNLNA